MGADSREKRRRGEEGGGAQASMRTKESGINNLFSLVGTRRGEQASGA